MEEDSTKDLSPQLSTRKIATVILTLLYYYLASSAFIQFGECQFIKSNLILLPGENFDLIEYVICNATMALPVEDFLLDDAQLAQRVDRVNEYSEYASVSERKEEDSAGGVDGGNQNGEVVYERRRNDVGKLVLVLQGEQDKLRVFADKRVFVVLRINPFSSSVSYFVNYAYLRSQEDFERVLCGVSYLMENICFEWAEPWEGNRMEVKPPFKYIGWPDCSTSFFTTCRNLSPNDEQTQANLFSDNEFIGGWDMDSNLIELADRGSASQLIQGIGKQNTKVPDELPFVTPRAYLEESGNDTTFTIFWDLDNRRAEGYHVRELIKDTSAITDPARAMLFQRDGKLKGFNHGVKPDLAFVTMMELAKQNYVTKYERDYSFERQESLYEILKRNLHKRTGLLGDISSATAYIGKIERRGRSDDVELKQKMEDLRMLDTQLQELDQEIGKQQQGLNTHNVNNHVTSDIFLNPGWKFLPYASGGDAFQPGASEWIENVVFYAFGTCEYQQAKLDFETLAQLISNVEESSNEGDPRNKAIQLLVTYYLTVLRLQCMDEARHYLTYLIDSGYLERRGFLFEIPENLTVLEKPKLSLSEYRMLSASLEFSVFTRTYEEEVQMDTRLHLSKSKSLLLLVNNVSRSIDFFLRFTARYVESARKVTPTHFYKMSRNIVITLKGVMTRLIQDQEILDIHCKSNNNNPLCDHVRFNNHQDRVAINAAIQLMLHGLSVLEVNRNADVSEMLAEFYELNSESIEMGLQYYEID